MQVTAPQTRTPPSVVHRLVAISARAGEVWIAAAIFFALALVFFNPIFRGYTFSDVGAEQNMVFPWRATPTYLSLGYPQSDEADTFYPWQVFINHRLRDGTVPLWNPYSFGGQPFFANGQSGVLYPPRALLALMTSADWVHDLLIFFHIFASGLAMFLLLKEYRAGFAGAMLAGVAWMFCSFTFAWVQLETFAFLAALLPAATACIHHAAARQSWRASCLAGLALALLILGGNISFVSLALIACLAYAGLLALRHAYAAIRRREWRGVAHALLQPVITLCITLGLSAIQLLPTLVLGREQGRAPLPFDQFRAESVVPLAAFRAVLWPDPLPITGYSLNYAMAFVGLPTALFAIIGCIARRPGATFARVLALVTAIIMVGTPLTWAAYALVPNFNSFHPLGRAFFLWDFAVAILGGIGLDAFLRWAAAPRAAARGRAFLRANAMLHMQRKRLVVAARIIATGAILLTAFPLIAYGRAINPPFQLREAQYLYPTTPMITAIETDRARRGYAAPQRVFPIRRTWEPAVPPPTLWASDAMLFDIQSLGGYDSIFPERVIQTLRVVAYEPPADVFARKIVGSYFSAFFVNGARMDLLPRLGVTTLVAPPDIEADPAWAARGLPSQFTRIYGGPDGTVYSLNAPVARAYVVHRAEIVETPLAALERFSDPAFDYRQAVVFERDTAPETVPTGGVGTSDVRVESYGTNDLTVRVRTDTPGWLVIADMWAPGWQAMVNGQARAVTRADFTLRAVPVPAGDSVVTLRYRPTEFIAGNLMTATTALALVGVLVVASVRSRRRNARRSD